MAGTRDVRLYIYNGNNPRGTGVTLTESRTIELETGAIAPVTNVDTSSTTKTETTIANIVYSSFEVTLVKLEYTKKIYEPCKIVAYLQMGIIQERTDVITQVVTTDADGKKSTSSKTDTGTYKPTKLIDNAKINLLKGAYVDLEIDNNKVAENYYVHKVRSIYKTVSGKTSLFVELTIFSRDKLMTLDKYSRAYTAKKLYTDILSQEAEKFDSVEVANHMQLLKYQDSSSKTTNRDELRIPYLVQYNESFYNFMVRSANRFGEFLYFEDGKLNLGMQPSETNYYRRDSSGKIIQTNDAYDIIDWATEPNAVQSRYYESVVFEGISVDERGHSYLDHTPEYEDMYASSDGRYNPDPTAANEWTDQDLEKNKYIEYDEALEEDFRCYGFEMLFKCLESSTIAEALVELGLDVSKWLLDVHKNNKDYNNVLDEANFDTIENEDQKSGDSYKQFVSYKGSSNLSNNLSNMFNQGTINNFTDLFYQIVRKKEKEVGEEAVWLDFGNYYRPIKLGDKLRVANKDYVAISVEGSYENGQEHLLVSAIPVFSISETDSAPQTATTAGDPWTTSVPLPPALPGVIIRDARPQVAFVAETLDPGTLGRIRVRYPWQDEEGDMSPWIRVTLPLATTGGAVNFTPSVGDEVMVGYVHGNIEHPYGMGYLTAPFVNERWKNAIPLDQYGGLHGIKVKTGHHLTFSDGANAASFVASIIGGPANFVKNFWPTGLAGAFPLGNEESSDFGGGFELADRYGFYKIKGSSDDRNITIESPMGTVNLNAFQGISIEAPNGDIEIKGKNVSIEAANRLSLNSGENIENKLYYNGWQGVGKTWGLDAAKTAWSHFADNFLDISFLRCLFEWFFIPVNGTLSIKSATFVTIEAGEGKAEVPEKSLRYGRGINDDLTNISKLIATINLINGKLDVLIDDIKLKYDDLYNKVSSYQRTLDVDNKDEKIITFANILSNTEVFNDNSQNLAWDDSPLKYEAVVDPGDEPDKKDTIAHTLWEIKKGIPTRNQEKEVARRAFVTLINQLRASANELVTAAKKIPDFVSDNFGIINDEEQKRYELGDAATVIKDLSFPTDKGFVSLDKMKNKSYNIDEIKSRNDNDWVDMKRALKRYAAYKYLTGHDYLGQFQGGEGGISSLLSPVSISSVNDTYSSKKWWLYVKSIENGLMDTLGDNWANENLNPFSKIIDDQRQWSHGYKGKILMSENKGKTSCFDQNLNLKPCDNSCHYDEDLKTLRTLLNQL